MQLLRGRGWVKATLLPDVGVTRKGLLEKQWIERRGVGSDLSYRISDQGMEAKTAVIPLRR
jgi:hypothetical protein